MFRWVERLRRGRAGQGGFSLVEVVVAVGLLVLVLVAVLPELVVGIRATSGAKTLTQAKGVLQSQLEQMRSMPYHVASPAGDKDLLDTYYPDMKLPTPGCKSDGVWTAADATTWSGYVAADKLPPPASPPGRCKYEPTSGAFYRTVKVILPSITAPEAAFMLVVDTAFVSLVDTSPSNPLQPPLPVAPTGSDYNSQLPGKDAPATWLVGVTATVVYRSSSGLKPVTTYTQISARNWEVSSLGVAATSATIQIAAQLTANMNANAANAWTGEPGEGTKAMWPTPASAEPIGRVTGWRASAFPVMVGSFT